MINHQAYVKARDAARKAAPSGTQHTQLLHQARLLRAKADSALESANYPHHGTGRPLSPAEIYNRIAPRGRDEPEVSFASHLKEVFPPFVEVIGAVSVHLPGVSHPKVAAHGYWGIYLGPTDPCFDRRTDGVLQKGHLILTAAGIVRRCWHLCVHYGSYPLRHRAAHLQRSPLELPGSTPKLTTILSGRGLGVAEGSEEPSLQTEPFALEQMLGPDYYGITSEAVNKIVEGETVDPAEYDNLRAPRPIPESAEFDFADEAQRGPAHINDLTTPETTDSLSTECKLCENNIFCPEHTSSSLPQRMTRKQREASWTAQRLDSEEVEAKESDKVPPPLTTDDNHVNDAEREGPRRSARARKVTEPETALDEPDRYILGTALETTKGPAIYLGASRGGRARVRFLTADSPEAVHSLPLDAVWLPEDRPHRYDHLGQLLVTAACAVASQPNNPTPPGALDILSPASWRSAYHVFVATATTPTPQHIRARAHNPKRSHHISRFSVDDLPLLTTYSSSLVEADLPTRHHQTMYHPLRPHIALGERRELQDMLDIPVCKPPVDLSTLGSDTKVIPTMWVYTCKADDEGNYERTKARLTMQGNRERLTLSKLDATAPVASPTTIRILIVLHIGDPDVRFNTVDVSQAYLTTEMKRTVYIGHPPGYYVWHSEKHGLQYSKLGPGQKAPKTAMELLRALYGGMECGRLFFEKYVKLHKDMGFTSTHYEQCLLILHRDDGDFIKIVFHVDDGLIVHKGEELWAWYQAEFAKTFQFTCKEFTRFLGVDVRVDYANQTVELTLEKQIVKFLRSFDMEDCNGSSYGPMPSNYQLPTAADIPEDPVELAEITSTFDMQSCVGHLGFLQHIARPDLSLVLKILSTATVKFGKKHIELARHAMRYLQATKHVGLVLRSGFARELQIYTDASHASHPDHRRSITGVIGKLCGCTIFWCCLYQKLVSHSSCESELIALDKGATIGHYLARISSILGAPQTESISIFVDSKSTIDITSGNPIQPGRNLHVHARYFFVRDCVIDKYYKIHHLPSAEQLADILCVFKSSATFKHLFRLLMGCCRVEINSSSGAYAWNTSLLHLP